MKVVMKDIAEALNISVVSVSKSLNDQSGVSESLRQLVKKKAIAMGYRGTVLKHAKPDKTNNICVIIPERFISRDNNDQSFYLDFYQLITSYFQKIDINTILYILKRDEEKNNTVPLVLYEKKVDGIIFMAELQKNYLQFIRHFDIPKVFLDFYGKNINIDCVTTDNYAGSYEITSELIEKGHKDIGFVGSIIATTSIQDRFLGYQKALYENKLQFNPNYLVEDRDDEGMYLDLKLPEQLPTAFVCNTDKSAYEMIKKLKQLGYSVPDDISIVGFDNDIYSQVSHPRVTTLEVSKVQMTKSACDFLLRKIDNDKEKLSKVTIKGTLIRRDSVKDVTFNDN